MEIANRPDRARREPSRLRVASAVKHRLDSERRSDPARTTFTPLGSAIYYPGTQWIVEGAHALSHTLSPLWIMTPEQTAEVGVCPFCEAAVTRRHVLIEYEADGEDRAYAECPACGEVGNPQ